MTAFGPGHASAARGLTWTVSCGPSDSDLVLLLRGRHPGAFDEVYRRYKDRVWRFLVRLSGRRQLAEDLFQDTWVAAARNAHRLREDTELGPWLFTIARNKHRNGLRSLALDQRKLASVRAEAPPAATLPDDDAEARRQAGRVAASFPLLPVAYREILLLALVDGLETAQIARILGLRDDAVRKRLSRARAELGRTTALEPRTRSVR